MIRNIQSQLEDASLATSNARKLREPQKREILELISKKLIDHQDDILTENQKDLNLIAATDPKKDRLLLSVKRISELSKSVHEISLLPDPSGSLQYEHTLENGLQVQKVTVPLGVVGIIYESRPNVTIDVAALCLRSGNVCLLRGGSDAFRTNTCLVKLIREALAELGFEQNMVQLLPPDRSFLPELLNATRYVDIIIPRGSQQLINFVRDNASVPVIETGAGVCHTYVQMSADLSLAAKIVTNAKVSRPSVCNSLDTVLVDRSVYKEFLIHLSPLLSEYEVEIYADPEGFNILGKLGYPDLKSAGPEDFGREFLDFKCSIKCVEGLDGALDHIRQYSSRHSESIISQDFKDCERFLNEVDAAAVYSNASTRFTDGGVFGLGAEIGISTQKLHARGPFALEKLVTEKWVIRGQGQVRE